MDDGKKQTEDEHLQLFGCCLKEKRSFKDEVTRLTGELDRLFQRACTLERENIQLKDTLLKFVRLYESEYDDAPPHRPDWLKVVLERLEKGE